MKKILKTSIYLLVAVLVGFTATYATSKLTPPDSVANTMYSLTDIYNLSAGTLATLGSGTIATTPTTVADSDIKTLTEVYTALSSQVGNLSAGVLASGTSAFGINGTALLSLGDATAGNVLAGKYFSNATTANVLGVMADKTGLNVASTAQSQAGGVNYFTATQGYYDGTAKVSATDAQVAALDTDIAVGNIKSGTSIFGVSGTLTSGGLPKTQQTLCYNTNGSAQTPCLAGDQTDGGQDGYYQKGLPSSGARFVDNSIADPTNITISDNATGLMWKKCSEGQSGTGCAGGSATQKTWRQALAVCEADITDSYTDWRLPNITELISIVDYQNSSPAINTTFFTAFTRSGYYWTSTTYKDDTNYAWSVNFFDGDTNYDFKPGSSYVRCVRG